MADMQTVYLLTHDTMTDVCRVRHVPCSSILACLTSLPSALNTPEAAAASSLPEAVPALLLTSPET